MSLAEEFAEFDREVAVAEVRLRRGMTVDDRLESYLAHCDDVRASFPFAMEAHARRVVGEDPWQRTDVGRLAELFDGPPAAS
jgi:hypothetical protein